MLSITSYRTPKLITINRILLLLAYYSWDIKLKIYKIYQHIHVLKNMKKFKLYIYLKIHFEKSHRT